MDAWAISAETGGANWTYEQYYWWWYYYGGGYLTHQQMNESQNFNPSEIKMGDLENHNDEKFKHKQNHEKPIC